MEKLSSYQQKLNSYHSSITPKEEAGSSFTPNPENNRMVTRTRKESEDHSCAICVERIDYYGIGECGHNIVCWRCIMKQRLKLEKKECPICK